LAEAEGGTLRQMPNHNLGSQFWGKIKSLLWVLDMAAREKVALKLNQSRIFFTSWTNLYFPGTFFKIYT